MSAHHFLSRREFLASAGAAALAGAPPRRPNVILILLDDLGYGDFGCYGQTKIRTPHTDRAALEGKRFTDCYAGGAVCAPSRSVLMTGLHMGHTPIRANAGTTPLAASDYTFVRALQQAGYATGGFGKWGLGDARSPGEPTRHGFDEFFGYLHQTHAHSYYPEFLWDNDRQYPLPGNAGGRRGQYSADIIADRSFAFLEKNRRRPFFLYASYTLPHARFEIPSLAPYENKPWSEGQKTYAAMITRADSYIGRLLALLRKHRLDRDTLVLITSDNGAHFGEEKGFDFFASNGILRGQKGELYEGGIRVPMIARWPGKIAAGSVSDYPWSFVDLFPTLADLAGLQTPPQLDGVSVAPVLFGGAPPAREFLYWEFLTYDFEQRRLRTEQLAQAVRYGDWKAVRLRPGAPLELYHLRQDPGEKHNVAAAHPDVIQRMEQYLSRARTEPRPHNQGSRQWVS